MSKRRDDFDEFSDPENPRELKYEEIVKASDRIRSTVVKTPCLASHHSKELIMHVYYKLENLQRTGSFKERGALNALLGLTAAKKKIGVVVSSVGNHAMAICHHANLMNIPMTVVMPPSVPINKVQQCHALGAKVLVQGNNITDAQRFARSLAREKGLTYINGRDHPAMLAGHGTVAMEILEQVPFVEAVIVPVGTGGLAAATAVVIKQIKPSCLVYGVEPEVMPALFNSLERGQPETCPIVNTIADSIAIPGVGVNAFCTIKSRLDKMLLVKEDWIARSILHLIEKERLVVEGAGACPLAAILADLVPELKTKTVVCVLSGGNIDTILLARALDRGLAAEARLVKFKVGLKDTNEDLMQLLGLMAANNYNVTRTFRDQVWVEDDVYHCEFKFVVETRGMEHALELKRIMEKAYPCSAIFETEPFNDRRTCPCYVRKAV